MLFVLARAQCLNILMTLLRANKHDVILPLQYLEKARKVESMCGSKAADVPGTLLNMCTILSELGRHSAALAHAGLSQPLVRFPTLPPPSPCLSDKSPTFHYQSLTIPIRLDRASGGASQPGRAGGKRRAGSAEHQDVVAGCSSPQCCC